jgi:hypothetical protein
MQNQNLKQKENNNEDKTIQQKVGPEQTNRCEPEHPQHAKTERRGRYG